MNLCLYELLNMPECPAVFHGDTRQPECVIGNAVIDSRKAAEADLFFAIRGERLNGHQFVPEVIQHGVLAVVVDRKWFDEAKAKNLTGNFVVVQDTLLALQEFAKVYRRKFSIPIIGLTGSVGKTTTKEMLAAILAAKYCVHKNEGNLNNHYGVPLTLFQLTGKHEIAIIEMGANHFGEIRRLAQLTEPTHAIITAVGRAHLEFFGSLEGVARAKSELFEAVKERGKAFVNADDPMITSKVGSIGKKISFGFENEADVKGEIISIDEQGLVTFGLMGHEIRLQTPGLHQAKNALAAAAVGLEFGIDISKIKSALEAYEPYSKRMEILNLKGIRVINDCYNSNPDSAAAALQVLDKMKTEGKKIAVLADMLELGELSESEHRKVGELVARLKFDALFGFGHITKFTVSAAKQSLEVQARHFEKKQDLSNALIKFLKKGDVVLIKGSRGMAMEEVTEAVRIFAKG